MDRDKIVEEVYTSGGWKKIPLSTKQKYRNWVNSNYSDNMLRLLSKDIQMSFNKNQATEIRNILRMNDIINTHWKIQDPKQSIKKTSAEDGPIDMVGGDEPTETGEEDLGMEGGGDLGGDMGGDPGMGDEMGGEGGMEEPGLPDVGIDWEEAEIIHTHDLEDSRENQEDEIDFTHLT